MPSKCVIIYLYKFLFILIVTEKEMAATSHNEILNAGQLLNTQQPSAPPPYHEHITKGEACILTSTHPAAQHCPRTPPPPYNPQPILLVHPKEEHRCRNRFRRQSVNLWIYIIIAICLGSFLLGLIKFVIVFQNKDTYHH